MKLTEYIYYIYRYLNIYRNKKIISISEKRKKIIEQTKAPVTPKKSDDIAPIS